MWLSQNQMTFTDLCSDLGSLLMSLLLASCKIEGIRDIIDSWSKSLVLCGDVWTYNTWIRWVFTSWPWMKVSPQTWTRQYHWLRRWDSSPGCVLTPPLYCTSESSVYTERNEKEMPVMLRNIRKVWCLFTIFPLPLLFFIL